MASGKDTQQQGDIQLPTVEADFWYILADPLAIQHGHLVGMELGFLEVSFEWLAFSYRSAEWYN